MIYLSILAGLALLLAGGEFLVRGAVAVAKRLGVSPLLIGLTLVGFGTSTPELMASVQAALQGSSGIAVGNVVGSNIANILLILGLSAVIIPLPVDRGALRRDGFVAVAAALLATAFCLIGSFDRIVGGVFVLLLAGYLYWAYRTEQVEIAATGHAQHADGAATIPATGLLPAVAMALGGLAAIVFGADLLVGGAIVLAERVGVSDEVIGLTLVAVGTSLPELVTSVMAALRRQPELAFGNIIGSNIYNVFGILGVTALVKPIPAPPQIAAFDTWVMVAVTLLLILFAVTSSRIKRWEGLVMLALYAAYLGVQTSPFLRGAIGLAAPAAG
ncbi:calcium/sodium antiporter [Rhodocista pekingensis]|uniref:Calcium/sodium antiporter n=1 Tax=Rhodocista pekingensis TaxID=201185 RepID=A0ABW2KYB9_9PROT